MKQREFLQVIEMTRRLNSTLEQLCSWTNYETSNFQNISQVIQLNMLTGVMHRVDILYEQSSVAYPYLPYLK